MRTARAVVTVDRVIDVVLPVLDEADAIPACPGVAARRTIARSWWTTGRPTTPRRSPRTSARSSSTSRRRGFGSACYAGLLAATHDVVCFMDCDGSLDGADLPRVSDPIEAGTADLVLGARVADRGAWPIHARAREPGRSQRRVRRTTGVGLRDLGPMRSARRPRCSSSASPTGGSAGRWRWSCAPPGADWRILEVDVPYRPRLGSSKVTGTVLGTARTVRDMAAVLR